jgi:hypothetical protein
MDKKYIARLFTGLLLIAPLTLMAERPAAEAEAVDTVPASPENMDFAPTDTSDNPYMSNETRTSGDVLDMDSGEAIAEPVRQLDFPRRGMSESKVQNELGRPIEIVPPVGNPPITRWVYDDRVVYFEYASVIHVVAR